MKENLPLRKDVSPDAKWHIEDYYANDTLWEEAYARFQQNLPVLEKFQGHLADSAQTLWDCFQKDEELSMELDQLYTYANMRLHEDSANAFYQGLASRAETLLIQYSAAVSFLTPELLAMPEEKLAAFRKEKEKEFQKYDHFFHNLLRKKAHILTPAEESLLAKAAELGGAPQNIFTMLNDADITFGNITDADGDQVPLTKGRYVTFLESPDRRVRKEAFDTLYAAYLAQKNTLAATYGASVKSDVFFAKARNYESARAMALADDNIPLSVYDNLIETVHAHLPLMHRYVALRKKLLGLEELHMYDLYAPLVADADAKISFAEAKETVKKALAVMGEDYVKALDHGMESGWIDVYENQGKRGGAYSWGSYGVHPFVLLNHNDTINSMFTLAHEMGHALHSYFTWQKQPYLYSGHKIFVAEVASTCNEALLMEYLLKTTTDETMRKYLINYYMEQFRGTLFRQTMFAEFEKITHEMAERGEPLTWEGMNQIYGDLNRQYFGDDIVIDEEIQIEWARIPHFYNAFYVYQYATGYSAAIALSHKILTEGQPAIDAYLDFLSKGDSEYSIDLLRGAGVDMSKKEAVENAMAVFEKLLDEMEALCR
ncbi:oligoendopeptidase F [Anaerotignum lactatifermentans]|uniref:Oligopeptidase F n=1 Tax=Anaerotignum lactatifermentans TaxID=160404 RepID=A0ABS2GDT5_9FIRM|nr:oligoendopeptidase F [Anaerotignum lactatifermentans]MBM6830414.1 oligoendopeptidase F [Anaerotignum lactatifermentans]MBM6878943.1 oligoendopeptidase F [Anaerotignum lactatifermentans]MBM6951987.1 oligoendopeptidase F [Anaerotignum lactatifermentans]